MEKVSLPTEAKPPPDSIDWSARSAGCSSLICAGVLAEDGQYVLKTDILLLWHGSLFHPQ